MYQLLDKDVFLTQFFYIRFLSCLAILFFSFSVFSQGATCGQIQPFCADVGSSGIVFRNTSNNSMAENGPDYGCLITQPNPAWYYLQIATDGILNLTISQNTQADGSGTGIDVDFIAWGPFNNTEVCTATDLSASNIVDCSFLPNFVENATIPNAVAGEIYILVITNFDGRPGFISLDENPNGASTDCSIVAGNLGVDLFPCENDIVVLDGTTNGAVSYSWSRNGVLLAGENQPSLNVIASGTYEVEVIDNMGNTDTDEIIITYVANPVPNAANDLSLCSGDKDASGNTTGIFDLSQNTPVILGTMNPDEFNVSYHLNQNDADRGLNPVTENYATDVANQQLFVRVENVLNSACVDTSVSFDLILNPNPEVGLITELLLCDDDADGDNTNGLLQNINLNEKDAEIINGQSDIVISYYSNQADANAAVNALSFPYSNRSNTETIFFRLEHQLNQCFSTGSFNLTVNPAVILQSTILEQCDGVDGSIDGLTQFNLEEANSDIITAGSVDDYTFAYYLSIADATSQVNPQPALPFFNTTANQTVYALATLNSTGCSGVAEVTLETTNTDITNLTLFDCDNSGFSEFNLREADGVILDPSVPAASTISYYETITDALLETNPLPDLYTNVVANNQTVYTRVEDGNSCFGIGELILRVNPLPNLDLIDFRPLCVNENDTIIAPALIDTGLSTAEYSFEWRLNGMVLTAETNESLNALSTGEYSVTVTSLMSGCQNMDKTTVFKSSPPLNITVSSISAAFSGDSSVTISVDGLGDYEYQVNSDAPQTSPTFNNLPSGNHIITVCDTEGCGCDTLDIFLIDYPRFFTPNGDGINDTWNVAQTTQLSDVTITIYDRYGKLLKSITPETSGWDGTYNGQQLPETDYWFKMLYVEDNVQKQLTGNFSLKR
jgi:gliding motility-associated-like protein